MNIHIRSTTRLLIDEENVYDKNQADREMMEDRTVHVGVGLLRVPVPPLSSYGIFRLLVLFQRFNLDKDLFIHCQSSTQTCSLFDLRFHGVFEWDVAPHLHNGRLHWNCVGLTSVCHWPDHANVT